MFINGNLRVGFLAKIITYFAITKGVGEMIIRVDIGFRFHYLLLFDWYWFNFIKTLDDISRIKKKILY